MTTSVNQQSSYRPMSSHKTTQISACNFTSSRRREWMAVNSKGPAWHTSHKRLDIPSVCRAKEILLDLIDLLGFDSIRTERGLSSK